MAIATSPTPDVAPGKPSRLRRWRPWLIGLGILTVIVLGFSLSAGVRNRGDDFLGRFRTAPRQAVAVIDVPLPRVAGVNDATIDDLYDVELPQGTSVLRTGEARDRLDFNVRTMRRDQLPKVDVFVEDTATIRLNRTALERSIAALAGPFGIRLPPELDTPVKATLTGVRQVWPDRTGDITLWIIRNPQFYTTEGPSWEVLRDRLIQMASVVVPERGAQLRNVSDWDNTLVVPVPPNATTSRVRADNTDDVLVIERDGRSTFVWQRYGALHILDAHMPARAAVQLVNAIR